MKDFHLLTGILLQVTLGIPVTSHIISLIVGSKDKALQASRHLLQAGFHVNVIKPPTVRFVSRMFHESICWDIL